VKANNISVYKTIIDISMSGKAVSETIDTEKRKEVKQEEL